MNNNQRVLFLFIAFLSFSFISAPTVSAQIGFAFGSNSNRLTEIDEFTSFESARGWNMEIWFDMPVGPLELRTGLRYVSAGSIFEIENDAESAFEDDVNINIFELPVDFRFRFNMEIITPYVALGPVLRFPSGGGDEISGMNGMHVAGGFGVGLELFVSRVNVYPEIKYVFGITSFTEDVIQIAQRTYVPSDNQLLNGFMVRLAVGF